MASQGNAFSDLVFLNRAVKQTYDDRGMGFFFQKQVLSFSFKRMEKKATKELKWTLRHAWKCGLSRQIDEHNTPTNNPHDIPIPKKRASYNKVIAFLNNPAAGQLLKSITEIDISNAELEFIPMEIAFFEISKN